MIKNNNLTEKKKKYEKYKTQVTKGIGKRKIMYKMYNINQTPSQIP